MYRQYWKFSGKKLLFTTKNFIFRSKKQLVFLTPEITKQSQRKTPRNENNRYTIAYSFPTARRDVDGTAAEVDGCDDDDDVISDVGANSSLDDVIIALPPFMKGVGDEEDDDELAFVTSLLLWELSANTSSSTVMLPVIGVVSPLVLWCRWLPGSEVGSNVSAERKLSLFNNDEKIQKTI